MVLSSNVWSLETHILDFSKNVLDKQQQYLDGANIGWDTFERNRDLKKSGNKKGFALRWIYMIIVLLIFSCGVLMILRRKFDYFFIDVIMVIVLSVGIIYILVLYLDMNSRSLTDYDKIRPDASTLVSADTVKTVPKYGISGGDASLENPDSVDKFACNGQACCFAGTTWNDTIKRCIKPEPFACMGPSLQNETKEFDYNKVYTKY